MVDQFIYFVYISAVQLRNICNMYLRYSLMSTSVTISGWSQLRPHLALGALGHLSTPQEACGVCTSGVTAKPKIIQENRKKPETFFNLTGKQHFCSIPLVQAITESCLNLRKGTYIHFLVENSEIIEDHVLKQLLFIR